LLKIQQTKLLLLQHTVRMVQSVMLLKQQF